MVTGKNKEQFEEWFNSKPLEDKTNPITPNYLSFFLKYPFEMQIGVYLAYYDSFGYVIDVMYLFAFEQYTFELENKGGDLNLPYKENLFKNNSKNYKNIKVITCKSI